VLNKSKADKRKVRQVKKFETDLNLPVVFESGQRAIKAGPVAAFPEIIAACQFAFSYKIHKIVLIYMLFSLHRN